MEKTLVGRAVRFFWLMFQLNLLVVASNVVLIIAMLGFVLHLFTLPIYILGAALAVPSLQALFLTIKRREELEKNSLLELYMKSYREEFKGALLFALAYIFLALLLLGSYVGVDFLPSQFVFVPVYVLLAILLYVHFIFGLWIRAHFIITIVGTWRLGLYCISRYPLKAFFVLGGTFILGALVYTFHQLIILGIVPMAVYLLFISSEKMFDDLSKILKVEPTGDGEGDV